ncbi:MAG: hypothetical protein RQ966_14470 [Acetobacteraceae bacterium]|nr:hypothetical protein [Acetobacteraceae bacterium]
MSTTKTLFGLAAGLMLTLGSAAMAQTTTNPPGTAAGRALDRAAGTNVSGAYPSQSNGTPGNPPGTAASRALDRAAGTDTSGAYPSQADGTRNNPPGTAATRAAHRPRHTTHHRHHTQTVTQ